MTTPRVLVVEDNDAVRTMLQEGLQREGFEVVAASNVPEALRHVTKGAFDVLLSDLHMPLAGDKCLGNEGVLFGQRIKTVANVVELLNFVQNRIWKHGHTAFLKV